MIFYYYFTYDETTDEFFAFVEDKIEDGATIFQIDDTLEVIDYINTGVMKHIDDMDGLAKHLIAQELMREGDKIVVQAHMY